MIGTFVTFTIPAIVYQRGEPVTIQSKQRGKVTRQLPNGKYEVRAVTGGYYELAANEISQ